MVKNQVPQKIKKISFTLKYFYSILTKWWENLLSLTRIKRSQTEICDRKKEPRVLKGKVTQLNQCDIPEHNTFRSVYNIESI